MVNTLNVFLSCPDLLTFDLFSTHPSLSLTDGSRVVVRSERLNLYPEHEEHFDCSGPQPPAGQEPRILGVGVGGASGGAGRVLPQYGQEGCSQSQSSTLKRTLTNHCLVKSP
uniref:Uncharacterized protein n=1 Tax=Knipowitschia caucasica TaxID=637954 RepID=A0AAV2JMZ5_KNICA